ncbi:MAG: flippase-like domain-containing protein [Synergistaceae bacterium]|jgi:uncharacterized membrane protein YbhN (UPF0104 family)|nr:flippase-like domain-containing protein [Synergistaceae bacterium]
MNGTAEISTRKKALIHGLWCFFKYGISVLCLCYAFWDVPLVNLLKIVKGYPLPPMLAVLGVSFTAYAVMGLRLSWMASPPLSFRSAFAATLVGLAINNVLPAKAGEVAKAVWLGRSNGISSQKALGLVLMERFFDVNVLAILSLWFLWSLNRQEVVYLFAACLAGGWAVLFLFYRHPTLTERFIRLFGRGGLGSFVAQALAGVLDNMSPRALVRLTATSLTLWFFYSLQTFLCLNAAAALGLPWPTTLSIFAVSSLGMLLPSSPGAIGVYEAISLTALKNCGIEPDVALTVTLFSHMAQFIPVTLVGGLIFMAFPENSKDSNLNQDLKSQDLKNNADKK